MTLTVFGRNYRSYETFKQHENCACKVFRSWILKFYLPLLVNCLSLNRIKFCSLPTSKDECVCLLVEGMMFTSRKTTSIKVMREQYFNISSTYQITPVAVCWLCSEIKWCQLRVIAPNQKGIFSLAVISWCEQRNSSKCISALRFYKFNF